MTRTADHAADHSRLSHHDTAASVQPDHVARGHADQRRRLDLQFQRLEIGDNRSSRHVDQRMADLQCARPVAAAREDTEGHALDGRVLDRQVAAKYICRWMAKTSMSSSGALGRFCRYLVGLPRLVLIYRWQSADNIDVYTDMDWAGCPRTRTSTNGGCIMLGQHTIKMWSSAHASISLGSGGAEFNGVVRGSGAGLGYRSLMHDLGQ